MGANEFTQIGKGKTAQEAFSQARDDAAWENGHGGYTGTLAEKDHYAMIDGPLPYAEASRKAWDLLEQDDERVCDKYGPAGCIEIADRENEYLFFGWASS